MGIVTPVDDFGKCPIEAWLPLPLPKLALSKVEGLGEGGGWGEGEGETLTEGENCGSISKSTENSFARRGYGVA